MDQSKAGMLSLACTIEPASTMRRREFWRGFECDFKIKMGFVDGSYEGPGAFTAY